MPPLLCLLAPSLQVKNKMSLESFRRNLRGVNDNTDFPVEFLDAIYYSIIKVSLSLNHGSRGLASSCPCCSLRWAGQQRLQSVVEVSKELLLSSGHAGAMSPCHASAAGLSQPSLLISGRFKAEQE